MKTLSFLTSFLLFSIFINNLFCFAAEAPDPVRDTTGKYVRAGIDYYILPVIRDSGDGLTLGGNVGNDICPLVIVQNTYVDQSGLPWTLTPVNPKKGVIRVSTDLSIKFSGATVCDQSAMWKLNDYNYSTRQNFIITDGVEAGNETLSNWFKIEKYNTDSKIVYCPTMCKSCHVICKDVGIFVQDGKRRLALSDVLLEVMFQKV